MLIVSDLDGTLIGDRDALNQFQNWFNKNRRHFLLAYATGRTMESVRHLISAGDLATPDFVIASVGTELIDCTTGMHDLLWECDLRDNWNAATVRKTLVTFPELQLQPADCQSSRKVSFFLNNGCPKQLAEIEAALAAAGLQTGLVYSYNRYLDVLPREMNKGTATRFLACSLGIPHSHVIVCGDSGNDVSLFQEGFCGVVVANAHVELVQRVSRPVYHASKSFADGVLEGVTHWYHRRLDSNYGRGIQDKAPDKCGWQI